MAVKSMDNLILDIYAELEKRPDHPLTDVKKKIAIVSTPRCGSSMFCDVLSKSGVCGDPKEWINMRYFAAYGQHFKKANLNLTEYLEFVTQKTTTPNGVFAINFHVEQYQELLQKGFDIFSLNFDKVIYLHRQDKLAQAYSFIKASLTNQWSSEASPSQKLEKGMINTPTLIKGLLHISSSEHIYEEKIKNKVDMAYAYEDFSRLSKTTAFDDFLALADITTNSRNWTTNLRKQRNESVPDEIHKLQEYLGFGK